MKKESEETVVEETVTEETVVTETEEAEAVVYASADDAEVEKTIRKSVYAAMGIGVVPVQLFNLAAVTAIQLDLVRRLSCLYGVDFKEGIAKKIIATVISSCVPALGSMVMGDAVIGIPLIGLPLAVGSKSILGGLSTYATGQMFVTHFKRGGGFIGANMDALKEDFSASFKNSRQWLGNTISGQKAAEGPAA